MSIEKEVVLMENKERRSVSHMSKVMKLLIGVVMALSSFDDRIAKGTEKIVRLTEGVAMEVIRLAVLDRLSLAPFTSSLIAMRNASIPKPV